MYCQLFVVHSVVLRRGLYCEVVNEAGNTGYCCLKRRAASMAQWLSDKNLTWQICV